MRFLKENVMLTLAIVSLAVSTAAAAPVDVKPESRSSGSFLIHKSTVSNLPNAAKSMHAPTKLSFAMGIGQDAKSFDAFVKAAKDNPKQRDSLAAWLNDVDWSKEAVAYAVLLTATNRLRVVGLGNDKTGQTVVQVQWSGIEPFYGERYPSAFARIPKEGLKRAVVSVTIGSDTLNTVVLGGKADQQKAAVRHLKLDRKGLRLGFGKRGAHVHKSLDELDKAYGEKLSAQVKKQVDFAKENVVAVQWTTGGPPFGTLEHVTKKKAVEFFVKGPTFPPGKPAVRGRALKIGFDLFAVPKGLEVTLAKGER